MISKKFFEFFPPPDYLNIPCAGLAISDNHVRLIYFKHTKNGIFLKNYKELNLAPGIIVTGNINNPDELQHVLEQIKKDTDISNVRASIPEEKAYLFEMQIPLVASNQVKSTIESQIEENVPLPASEIIFDYNVVKQDLDAKKLTVIVSALPYKTVEMYQQIIIAAGFNLYGLEIESEAVARSVIAKNDKNTSLIVHFSLDKVGVYIVSGGVVHFTSTTNFPRESVLSTDLISNEINKILGYWKSKETSDYKYQVSHIFICGENVDDQILESIENSTKVRTSRSQVWQNAFDINKSVPEIPLKDSLKYASAIGLALPSKILI